MNSRVISFVALLLMAGCGIGAPCKSTDGSGESCASSGPASPPSPDPRSCLGAFYCGVGCNDSACKTACFDQVAPAQKEALHNLDSCAAVQCSGQGDACDAFKIGGYSPAACFSCEGAVVQNQHGTPDACKSFLAACSDTP